MPMQPYNIPSVTCDVDKFSNGVGGPQGQQLGSADTPGQPRHWSELYSAVFLCRAGATSGGGGGRESGFRFQCRFLGVDWPPGSFSGAFNFLWTVFYLIESEADKIKRLSCNYTIQAWQMINVSRGSQWHVSLSGTQFEVISHLLNGTYGLRCLSCTEPGLKWNV